MSDPSSQYRPETHLLTIFIICYTECRILFISYSVQQVLTLIWHILTCMLYVKWFAIHIVSSKCKDTDCLKIIELFKKKLFSSFTLHCRGAKKINNTFLDKGSSVRKVSPELKNDTSSEFLGLFTLCCRSFYINVTAFSSDFREND